MYESHFGLQRRPFLATPDPDCFVASESAENALAGLRLCIEAQNGFGILSAPAGTGKTLLCRKLIVDLRQQFAAVYLANSNFPTRRSLLQAVLYELGHPYLRMAEQELRLELKTAAVQIRPERQAVLLVVDEAHLLSTQLLEELRTASDLDADGAPLVHVVLSGQLLLEEKLASPEMEALNQRIGCQVTLDSLSRQESAMYVAERLRWAGADVADVIQPDALQMICHAADGLPRCLNQLCDHSLLLAYAADQRLVGIETVREALDDLKQLPLHWNEPLPAADGTTIPPRDAAADAPDRIDNESAGDEWTAAESRETSAAAADDQPQWEEAGESAMVEVGAFEEDEPTEPVASIEVGAGDVADDLPATVEMVTMDAAREEIEITGEADLDEPPVGKGISEPVSDDVPDASVLALHGSRRQHRAGGVEEEIVVDRYAMLDAGRPLAERALLMVEPSDTISITRPLADRTISAADARMSEEGDQPSSAEAELRDLVADAGESSSVEELLDAIEPMIGEALSDGVGRSGEPGTTDQSETRDITLNAADELAGADETEHVEEGMPADIEEDVDEAVEYDVVQPEKEDVRIAAPPLAEIKQDAETEKDAETVPVHAPRPQGRYAHLFSRLRRRQRSA